MIAGPQILSAIFLATSEKWQRNTAAYLGGAGLSITLIVSIAYLASSGAPRKGGSNNVVNILVLVLLLAAMVHDFLTSLAVGSYLSSHGDPWWQLLPFLLLTLLFLALPALLLLVFGKRGQAFLPKARDWMNTNSWLVSEIVLVFFIAITINSLVG